MKYIVSLVASLAISAVAYCAQVNWGGMTEVNLAPSGGTLTSYTAYLVAGSSADALEAVETIKAGGAWTTWKPAVGSDGNVISRNLNADGSINTQGSEIAMSSGRHDFYIVIFDESNGAAGGYFMVSSAEEQAVYNPGEIPFTNLWWADTIGATSGGWQVIPVPEPTVMALLALGVAGLALRRKVA